MNANKKEYLEQIREQYAEKTTTKLDELKALDKKVKLPAEAFAYLFGVVGTLVLGVGMCLEMKVIADLMPLGIVVGVLGIIMVSANYYFYKGILNRRKKKYSEKFSSSARSFSTTDGSIIGGRKKWCYSLKSKKKKRKTKNTTFTIS